LVTTIPDLTQKLIIAAALTVPVLGLLWRLDRFRVRLRTAAIGSVACLAGITALSLAFPQEDWEAFFGDGYVSKFSRSGVAAISALMMHGYMESDAVVTESLSNKGRWTPWSPMTSDKARQSDSSTAPRTRGCSSISVRAPTGT
jgi:hypothetical protein